MPRCPPVLTQLSARSNVVAAGPAIIRKRGTNRSNLELVSSLRENFAAAQNDFAPGTNGTVNGDHDGTAPVPLEAWTERCGNALLIPRIDGHTSPLRDEQNQYEITVKLFLLPDTPVSEREGYVREALNLVRQELAIQTVDLLVVSFPGMSFEGTCEWEADKRNAQQGNLEEEVATWRVFEDLHCRGLVGRLGVAEFGSEKLAAFLARITVPPAVDQINLRDCCDVPPPLTKLARDRGIELNVHKDCTDILPCGTLRELLGPRPHGAGVLADPANPASTGLRGEIIPHWVVRYLAFVRDRGVIENKGYFAGADLLEK